MNVKTKEKAVKVGIDRADHNQPIGHVSNDAALQRQAEAARARRLEEIRIAKANAKS